MLQRLLCLCLLALALTLSPFSGATRPAVADCVMAQADCHSDGKAGTQVDCCMAAAKLPAFVAGVPALSMQPVHVAALRVLPLSAPRAPPEPPPRAPL